MAKKGTHYSGTAYAAPPDWPAVDKQILAWSNFMTDEAVSGRVITQVNHLTWLHRGVGRRVCKCFHFVPGDIDERVLPPPQNDRITYILESAESLFAKGIALHALQDAHTHRGFVGGWSKLNSRSQKSWWRAFLPDYCHTDMLDIPDKPNTEWSDNGVMVRNNERLLAALCQTARYLGSPVSRVYELNYQWNDGTPEQREAEWEKIAGVLPYDSIKDATWKKYGGDWEKAAVRQREALLETF